MPTYLTKWPEEAVWAAILVGAGLFLTTLGTALGWDMAKWAPVITSGIGLARLIIGALLPTPTVAQETASVRESIDDKPEPLP